jgi:hypothetical protein
MQPLSFRTQIPAQLPPQRPFTLEIIPRQTPGRLELQGTPLASFSAPFILRGLYGTVFPSTVQFARLGSTTRFNNQPFHPLATSTYILGAFHHPSGEIRASTTQRTLHRLDSVRRLSLRSADPSKANPSDHSTVQNCFETTNNPHRHEQWMSEKQNTNSMPLMCDHTGTTSYQIHTAYIWSESSLALVFEGSQAY